ncbi:MAG: hypothetical protein KKG04_01155 [Candidatus Thermoplasmatota archaeon]|nr:hypothetical protein [Candidatus Thermoplasmatota archaeon]
MEDVTKKLQRMVQTRKTPIVIQEQELNRKYKRQSSGTSIESYAFNGSSAE